MLSVVCFSKDRPLQLEAYLESLMHYGGLNPASITVLVATSPGISYDHLIARFPAIRWVRETSFRDDLLKVLDNCENYVLLGCDDVVFTRHFDVNNCIRTLARDADVFGFSLRLGSNLNFLPRLEQGEGVLTWTWREARGEYWRYPWEVSASVYRRAFVLDYVRSRTDVTNPNRFESYLAKGIAEGTSTVSSKLACFPESCCATITVNRVQDEFPNDFDKSKDTSPEALYRAHVDGLKQDWTKIADWTNDAVHVGAEAFHLVSAIDPPKIHYDLTSGQHTTRTRQRSLAMKILWWRVTTTAWEAARKRLPRPVLGAVKVAVRKLR